MTAVVSNTSARQYLTILLGDEEYAIEILRVQEIKGLARITPIPNSPTHVKGVMNLRGTVVPVLDLRSRFGMPPIEYSRFTVVVLVTVGTRMVGLVVDAVSDVVEVPNEEVESAPDLVENGNTMYIHGLTKIGDRMLALLNIDRLVQTDLRASNNPVPQVENAQ